MRPTIIRIEVIGEINNLFIRQVEEALELNNQEKVESPYKNLTNDRVYKTVSSYLNGLYNLTAYTSSMQEKEEFCKIIRNLFPLKKKFF